MHHWLYTNILPLTSAEISQYSTFKRYTSSYTSRFCAMDLLLAIQLFHKSAPNRTNFLPSLRVLTRRYLYRHSRRKQQPVCTKWRTLHGIRCTVHVLFVMLCPKTKQHMTSDNTLFVNITNQARRRRERKK